MASQALSLLSHFSPLEEEFNDPSFAAWPNRSNKHTVEQGVLPLQREELRTDIPRSERVNGKAPYSGDLKGEGAQSVTGWEVWRSALP